MGAALSHVEGRIAGRCAAGTAAHSATELVHALLEDQPALASSRALVLVKCFGGTPLMEAYIVLGEVLRLLRAAGTTPVVAHTGAYLTSLQITGPSLTTTVLTPEAEALIAAPVHRWPIERCAMTEKTTPSLTSGWLESWLRALGPAAPRCRAWGSACHGWLVR